MDQPSTDTHDLSGIEHATDDFTEMINENPQHFGMDQNC